MDCDWRVFLDTSKECLSCSDFEKCRSQKELRNPENRRSQFFLTSPEVEEDAKLAADLIREMDAANSYYDAPEFSEDANSETDEDEETQEKETKGYQELTPIAEFFRRENIPILYNPPNDIFASNFMLVSYAGGGAFIVRLTGMGGVPYEVKLTKKLYKDKGKTYKYVRRGTFDVIFPLIRSVVFYRKSNGK